MKPPYFVSFLLLNFVANILSSEICQEDPLCRAIDHLHDRISSIEQPVWDKSSDENAWGHCDRGDCTCQHPKISGTVDCWGKFLYRKRIPEDQVIPIDVEILDLGNNHIPHLNPHLFKTLLRLKEVNLFGMGIKYLPEYIFETNERIQILKIQDNMLRMLEPKLFKFMPLVEYLDVSGNMFEGLPDAIFQSNNRLKILNLSNNKLKVISPELFNNLDRLEVLDLSQNRLRVLDEKTFIDLINLNKLFMSRNVLEVFPSNLFKNTAKLKSLDVSINEFAHFPPTLFQNIEDIKYLFLAGNKFDSLTDDDHLPKSLHHLDMSNNVISVFNISEPDYSWLYLDLSNNAIKTYSFKSLNHLKTLRLNLNQITLLRFEEFSTSISELYLHRNLIESIVGDGAFKQLNSLTKLSISDNYWTCDCRLGDFLKWLNQLDITYDESLCEAPANYFGMSINTTMSLEC